MGGGGGARGRRALDTDINMVPMIDLLMVTIAFLLVTAVWSQLGRLEGSAKAPSAGIDPVPDTPESRLHVDMRAADRYVLSWRQGSTVVRSTELPHDVAALREGIAREWRTSGVHTSPGDPGRDQAVLHVPNGAAYGDMVAVMDAVEATHRPLSRGEIPAFALTLASE